MESVTYAVYKFVQMNMVRLRKDDNMVHPSIDRISLSNSIPDIKNNIPGRTEIILCLD